MANQVEIIIKATDKYSSELNKTGSKLKGLNAGFKELTGISLGAAGGIALAGKAIQEVIRFTKQAVDETVAYATSIDSMSRLLGISTEETSRLVQASDDLFISQEKLQTALLAATRKGIDVSIDGLKELSKQYLALAPGVDRGKFLMDNFGRSGAEMGKLMEVGAEGIDAATAAIADNLIITGKSMQEIVRYKQSIDTLNDSWQGLKFTIGMEVIPAVDLLIRTFIRGKDPIEEFRQKGAALLALMGGLSIIAAIFGDSALGVDEKLKLLGTEFLRLKDAADKAGVAMDNTTSNQFPDFSSGAEKATIMVWHLTDGVWAYINALYAIPSDRFVTIHESRDLSEWGYSSGLKGPVGSSKKKGANDWVYKGTKGGEGTAEAWWSPSLGEWDYRPGKAGGGMVAGNTPYLIGEKGPELFVPHTAGRVVPNNQLQGGGESFDYYRFARIIAEELQKVSR